MDKLEKILFNNIGKSLKRYAVASFIVEAVLGIIAGIAVAISYESIIFILISFAAPFVAYTFSMFLYGFGELVDSTSSTARVNKDQNNVIAEDELPEL